MEPFVGQIQSFGFNFAPRGWAQCNGQLLPIAQNTALFSLLGTTYGGDGRTTFGLPDLRGRAPLHVGQGTGLAKRDIGSKGGQENVTLSVGQMPNHTHAATVKASDQAANSSKPTGNTLGSGNIYHAPPTKENLATDMVSIGATGSNEAHTNMPPYLTINWCICLIGLFPSRT